MYKFKFSSDTKDKYDPKLSLFWVFCVYFTGATIAAFVLQAILGNDMMAVCEDPINCMAVNGLFNIVSFLLFPLLYLFYYEKRDFTSFSGEEANLSKQWYLILFGFLTLLAFYPAIIKMKDLAEVFFNGDTYASFEKNAFNGTFNGFYGRFKSSETYQAEIIENMISVTNPLELMLLFLVIAIIPAIAEEFFFRGVLQNIVMKLGANPHVAIWLIGVTFSAMHFSLTDFVPRIIMGALLGYTYYFSKNFWVPVGIHFLNNALSIINLRAVQAGDIALDLEKDGNFSIFHLMISVLLGIVLLWWFKKNASKTLPEIIEIQEKLQDE